MMRLLMLFAVLLCAQYSYERHIEHKVFSKIYSYSNIFRIDESFDRSYASLGGGKRDNSYKIIINNEKWKINKYIKSDKNIREELNIETVVNAKRSNDVRIGESQQVHLELVVLDPKKIMVLKNPSSNEIIELVPVKFPKIITQNVKNLSSSIKSSGHTPVKKTRVNGIELMDVELVFVQASIPKVSKQPIYNNAINGFINLIDGGIDSGELVFNNTLKLNKEIVESIELNYVDIKNGGHISFEYMGSVVSGIFSKASNETYVMRVATGVLSGSSFTFSKYNSDFTRKISNKLVLAKKRQDDLVKQRSLAGLKALERSGYSF